MLEPSFYQRLEDLIDRNLSRDVPLHTDFLDPASQGEALALCRKRGCRASLVGGYPSAERNALCLLPSFQDDPPSDLVAYLRITSRGHFAHPDLLGALMALGVSRGCLGDLLLEKGERGTSALVYALARMAPHLASIQSVGRHEVRAEILANPEENVPDENGGDGRIVRGSLASLRADSVLAAAFSLPRSRASALFDMGAVQLNWQPCEDRGRVLKPGDTLSVRHYGRAILLEVGGQSRKNRSFVLLQVFG